MMYEIRRNQNTTESKENKMYWEKIDEKHRTRFNSNFILCEEMYEISYIIQAIMDFYPKLPRDKITNAIYKALREVPHPRLRHQFWKAVSEKLDMAF